MLFGLATKRELDRLREDVVHELRKSSVHTEEMEYEWTKWFNKFRSLYAMLLKREKSADQGEAQGPEGQAEEETASPGRLQFRSRRGF